MKTVNVSYFFRSFPTIAAADVPVGIKPATVEQRTALAVYPECFELGKADFQDVDKKPITLDSACRKAVEGTLEVPEPSDIPANSALLAHLIEQHVRTYVKLNYIDKYQDIGAHDWDTLEAAHAAAIANTGGFTACQFSDEQLTAAQASFTAYLNKVAPKLAAATSKLITGKATKRACQSALAAFGYSEATLSKLLQRIIEAAANDEANAGALAYCAERVEALIKAEQDNALSDDDM